ncbi:MAG: Ig-like domain-containing protein [Lachnospiraceae bacterium]|nr:Ig-like domain-containing protein [Lachnospiraceae bacterium]
MKKKIIGLISFICIAAIVISLLPMGIAGAPEPAAAADTVPNESTDTYCLVTSAKRYFSGDEINYSDYDNGARTLQIYLSTKDANSPIVLATGTAIEWRADNPNVIGIDTGSSMNTTVNLTIKAPGYSGLTVSLTPPGSSVPIVAVACVIKVPLEWDDANNIKASSSTPVGYGLLTAQNEDPNQTLQLYTENSSTHPDCYHYVRRLRNVDYNFLPTSGYTGKVTSAAPAGSFESTEYALNWTSSDNSVCTVDRDGVITAHAAGFCRISVTTDTGGNTLSFNVIVVPEAILTGVTTDYKYKFTARSIPDSDNVVINTNAFHASDLDWHLFRGEQVLAAKDVTKDKDYKDKIDVSAATGTVTLKKLPAGVYVLGAIPIKKDDSTIPTYDYIQNRLINKLEITIVVPLSFGTDSLTLSIYNKGESFDSYDILENSNLPANSFHFVSNKEEFASVGLDDGVIEAVDKGKARITATPYVSVEDMFGSFAASPSAINYDGSSISLDVEVIEGMALNTTSETLYKGDSFVLKLEAPSEYSGRIEWKSSNDKVVKVDNSGVVSAVGVGDASVYCYIWTEKGTKRRARCRFNVVDAVSGITLKSSTDYVMIGENLTISADVTPKLSKSTLTWTCSDESIASIAEKSDLSMTITGVKEGTIVITALNKDNGIVASKVIKVVKKLAALTLSEHEVTLPQTQKFYQLYAVCTPALPENQKLTWKSSNTKVVDIDKSTEGKILLKNPGTAVITVVSENGLTDQCTFVVTQGIKDIKLDATDITIYVGEKQRITYTITPDNASNLKLKWNVLDSKVCSVDSSGYVTGKNAGTTVITVESTDGTGIFKMITVHVLQSATSIKLDIVSITMNVGEHYLLEVALTPVTSSDVLVFESTNTKVATVSKTGKITAKAKGSCVVFVRTSGGLSTYCTVEVIQQVTGVSLNLNEATVYVGEKMTLEATVSPKNVTDDSLKWESNNTKIATVDKNGTVTGVKGGTTLIRVITEDGDFMAYCILTVIENVTVINLQEEAEVGVGRKLKLEATVVNEGATNKKLEWSTADSGICKVNEKGVLTGVKVGKTVITASATDDSGAYAQCEVTVIDGTDEIDINGEDQLITMIVGESRKIRFSTVPSNTTYKPIWTSENEKIAVVNKNGQVSALSAGTTTVIAMARDNPDVKAYITVMVSNPVLATNVIFSDAEVIMTPGEQKTVPFTIVPSNVTESYTWSSDNPVVASVDEKTGKITAKSVGSASITLMTKSGKKGSVRVFVVGLSKTYIELGQYDNNHIKLEIDGAGSGSLTVRWDTDNQSIADISNGTITARKLGTTKVYAVVNGRSLACTVKVVKNKKR